MGEKGLNFRKILKLIFLLSPFIIVPLIIIFRSNIVEIGNSFAPCITYRLGFYCPGCGNTRALIALLHGNIINSVRFNPLILFFVMFLIAYYIECVADFIGKDLKIIPRNKIFWAIISTLGAIFYILRNFIEILSPGVVV